MDSVHFPVDYQENLRSLCQKPRNLQRFSENLKKLQNSFKFLLRCKDLESAEILVISLEKSVNINELLDEISDFYYHLSVAIKNENLLDKSLIFAKKSLKYCKRFKSKSEKTCKSLMLLASIQSKQGHHGSAKRKLQKSSFLISDLINIQNTLNLKQLFLVNLLNLATEEEVLGNYEAAYSVCIESLIFMNTHFSQPDPSLSSKISVSIERINNLMKNRVPRINRDKKVEIVKDLTTSEETSFKPLGKSIRDTTVRSSGEPSPKLSVFQESQNFEGEDLKYNETFARSSENNTQFKENPFFSKSQLSGAETEEKPEKNLFLQTQKEKNIEAEDPLKEPKELKFTTEHKDEIKSLFGGIFKTKPVPAKPDDEKVEKGEKVEVFADLKGLEKKKTCIMTSKIDIDMNFSEVKYFFKSGVSMLEVMCTTEKNTYTIDLNIPANLPVFNFITENIEPCLVIKNEKIAFEESAEVVLANGMFIREKGSGYVKIVRFYPRWRIQVSLNDQSQVFEMADIKNHFPVSVDFTKDLNSLISLFVLDSKGIQISLVMSYPLEKIYEGSVENDYLRLPLDLHISKVSYLNSFSYLLQVKESPVKPLLIESQVICKKTNRLKPTLNETINFLIKNISLDSRNQLQLIEKAETDKICESLSKKKFSVFQSKKPEEPKKQFNKSAMFSNLQGLHDGLNKAKANPPQSPSPIVQPLQNYSRNTLLSDMSKVLLERSTVFEVDAEDRIILRTCLYRDSRIYQICMSLTEGKILNFYIRKGSEAENLNKFSIKVSTLCKKTGLRKDLLIPLGSYVLRNMLVIKEADICYFDFSKTLSNPIQAIEKISGLFKAFYARRKVKLKLKHLAGKRKIKMEGLVYTCLVYMGDEALFVRLVRGAEVFSLDLSLSKVVKDGLFVSVDKFFMSLVSLGFRIVEKNGKKTLAGLEKYRIV